MSHAATIVQLYNQMLASGRDEAEILEVALAYALVKRLYSGHYLADGRPFVCHAVGTAAIVESLGLSQRMVIVAMLHSSYGNADFGDGRPRGWVTQGRRAVVREAIGEEAEAMLYRFRTARVSEASIAAALADAGTMSAEQRAFALIDLADALDKLSDANAAYYTEGEGIQAFAGRGGAALPELARRLGEPGLAAQIDQALTELAAAQRILPPSLRQSAGHGNLRLIVPGSCRRSMLLALLAWVSEPTRRWWLRLRRVTRAALRPATTSTARA